MEQVVPWNELLALVGPHYRKAGNGRQPVGFAIALRTYFCSSGSTCLTAGMEEAFCEPHVLRRFVRVDLVMAAAPDETTILRLRHLPEENLSCHKHVATQ